MTTLHVRLLGAFHLVYGEEPVVQVDSPRLQSLLAYLLLHADAPQSRQHLAFLLWPDSTESQARTNLRNLLYHLRRALPTGDRFLHVTHQTLQWHSDSPYTLDVSAFLAAARRATQAREASDFSTMQTALIEAVELYRGDLVPSCYADWIIPERERLAQVFMRCLEQLIEQLETVRDYSTAIRYAQRLLQHDELHEPIYRRLMRLYARSGERPRALDIYHTCVKVLDRELGVAPAAETTALFAQIEADVWDIPTAWPAFLQTASTSPEEDRELFVGREHELARLGGFLENALADQGGVVFVTGEAGSGKTALVHEFAWRAQALHPDLVVAIGHCDAHAGIGDPYLPFREVLALLSGDVESRVEAGLLSREMAGRLWTLTPTTAQALLDFGPHLLDTFVPASPLASRLQVVVGQSTFLAEEVSRTAPHPSTPLPGEESFQPGYIHQQYGYVLEALAARRPLLLLLDDLHWADASSISLLFYLSRRISANRILIVGNYRPEDVVQSLGGEWHPLEDVTRELKRLYGDIWVDLNQVPARESRRFVDALVDAVPNQLGEDFRQALYARSQGHALFTTEILHDLREQGGLRQDTDGRWVASPALAWETLPARVEGVIERRVGRLPADLRHALEVASVEGEDFTAEVIARVEGLDPHRLVRRLSDEMDKQHRLVIAHGIQRMGPHRLSVYRFRHQLFQKYLYDHLDEVKRASLHENVGIILEELHGKAAGEIAGQLAWHFLEAGIIQKAIRYSLEAGDRARLLYAHRVAIRHYMRALALLQEQGEHERAARTYMKLGLTYHTAFDFRRARQAYEEGFTLWQRAGERQAVSLRSASHSLRMDRANPVTLDPTLANELQSMPLVDQLFSSLVRRTPELDIVPDVARTWEVLNGGRTYIFHLRDDVYWTDGTPLTAGDFEYAWKRVLNPIAGSPKASLLYDVRGARAFHQGETPNLDAVGMRSVDDTSVVVELEDPAGYFLHLLAFTYPVPRHIVQRYGENWTAVENIVTNGPFKLAAWQPDEAMTLVRNSAYHGRFTGNVQQVELSLGSDQSTALEMYEADRLDVLSLWRLSPQERVRLMRQYPDEYVSVPDLCTYYIAFDVSRPPFDDPRVRRGFTLATDREGLADVTLQGFAFPALGGFVPPGIPGHLPAIGLPYDPARARRLLAQAGFADPSSFPVITALTAPGTVMESEYLHTQWNENLGIDIRWEVIEWAAFLECLNRAPPPMFLVGWSADYPDPDNFLRVGAARRFPRWYHARYIRLVEQACRVTEQATRIRMYSEADRILVEEAPIMPLTYGRQQLLVKPWVRNYPTTPLGVEYWFGENVIIEHD